MTQKVLLGAAIAVVFLAGVMLPRSTTVERVVEKLGAAPSNEFTDNLFSVGGVRTYSYSTKMSTTATTTPCAFKTPAATTSIQFATANVTTSTSTASVIGWYLGASPNSTSTATLAETGASGIAANAKGSWTSASSTIVSPNQYVVFGAKGAANGFIYGGTCNLKLIDLGR